MGKKNNFNEDEDIVVTLTLDDDQEVDCEILTIFTVGEQDYIALLPQAGHGLPEDEALLYRYFEEEDLPRIENIESEEEYELANRKRLDNKKKLELRKNKLNFIYDSSGKKLVYCNSKGNFIYQAKGFQVCEKTLIKMLYSDAIYVLKEIQKNST